MRKTGIADRILLVAAVICLVMALMPYQVLKPAADRLSPDGNMERFTPQISMILRIGAAAGLVLFAGMVLWNIRAPESRKAFFSSAAALPGRCFRDIVPFFRDLRGAIDLRSPEFLLISILFISGSALRILQVGMPLFHDEAYSMAIWGRSDLLFAVSDYHLPNNHVFHSVLVNLIYHHLGKSPELLRLPVLVSGCLLIPAVWLLGKLFYGSAAGLTAAGFCAFAPFLVSYSVNARGYELQAFLSVLTAGLAVYGKRRRNVFAWFLLILLSGLNFFTLPIALYPFGGICIWLFLNVVFYREERCAFRGRAQLFKYLIFMGLSVSLLSMLLYLPLLRYSGWNSFFGNIYIGGVDKGAFGQTMLSRLIDNAVAFTDPLPVPVICLIVSGLILSPFLFRSMSKEHISFGASLLLWMALVIPFQKPNLWPRTLLFLHPFLLLFCASGLCGALRILPGGRKTAGAVCALAIAAAAVSQFYQARDIPGTVGPDERAVQLILEREGKNAPNVHFVTAAQDNAPVWIYADAYGLPRGIFDKNRSFNTVYALVNPKNDAYLGPKDLDDLLERFGPGNNFIDLKSGDILMEDPYGILYRFSGVERAIRKGFGEYPEIPSE